MVGVQLRRAPEAVERLVPLLVLDGDATQEVIGLSIAGLDADEPLQHGARLVVGLLLEVLLGQGEVGVLRLRVEGDGLLQLLLGVGELLLAPEQIGQRQAGGLAGGLERDGLPGRFQRGGHVADAKEPLRELHPQERRPRILLDGLTQLDDGVLDAALPRRDLGDAEVVVSLGESLVVRGAPDGGALRPSLGDGRRLGGGGGHTAAEPERNPDRGPAHGGFHGDGGGCPRAHESSLSVGRESSRRRLESCRRRASKSLVRSRRREPASAGSGNEATIASTTSVSS